MVKLWDNGMKRLLAESPQDFLDWLLDGAYFTVEDLLIKVAMAPTQEEAQNVLLSSDDE